MKRHAVRAILVGLLMTGLVAVSGCESSSNSAVNASGDWTGTKTIGERILSTSASLRQTGVAVVGTWDGIPVEGVATEDGVALSYNDSGGDVDVSMVVSGEVTGNVMTGTITIDRDDGEAGEFSFRVTREE